MGVSPEDRHEGYIASQAWADRRTAYYEEHEKMCAVCGDVDNVHLHHLSYIHLELVHWHPMSWGKEEDDELIPLCSQHHRECHNFIDSCDYDWSTYSGKILWGSVRWLLDRPHMIIHPMIVKMLPYMGRPTDVYDEAYVSEESVSEPGMAEDAPPRRYGSSSALDLLRRYPELAGAGTIGAGLLIGGAEPVIALASLISWLGGAAVVRLTADLSAFGWAARVIGKILPPGGPSR
jgi:hypothetical protein